MERMLVMRISAPLMSFGGYPSGSYPTGYLRPTRMHPLRSMITGILGSALGYQREDTELLSRLQGRIEYAARVDRATEGILTDLHTTKVKEVEAWGAGGKPVKIGPDGPEGTTDLRYDEFLQGAVYTVVVRLNPAEGRPTVDDLAQALKFPARPIFYGRKCCLPSGQCFLAIVETDDMVEALMSAAPCDLRRAAKTGDRVNVWWVGQSHSKAEHSERTALDRNWAFGIHTGSGTVHRGSFIIGGGQ